ncbi:Ubiquitin carboxyl-terminal hydrolase 14 [Zancudomyces culisetae]|uniref:Ubiquitin carboxyl-terminal hydrolase n=1 Tax=Zancudomyces culisetae TaxID=1213189 RepID=A0A1R1PYS2_ZANCU|nr:Ubiquitin carboxyl-terminal hydrolase 14 [Zancudomyces culisetae]|eukprot:OMH86095.1 Ubiquitin carboxyl-terminal hydrolase 14 [Zancudomyces culisetae]
MMGSTTKIPSPPPVPTKFYEDMSTEEINKALNIPVGLVNLGNTCYFNATLQCMKASKELKEAISKPQTAQISTATTNPSDKLQKNLLESVKQVFSSMDTTDQEAISPVKLLSSLQALYPQFAEREQSGMAYKQQDAEECWNVIMNTLAAQLKVEGGSKNLIDSYFGGEMVTTYKCKEAPDEMETTKVDAFRKLDCRIDKSVLYLQQGLKLSLNQTIEKHSETLNKDVEYIASSQISRLPKYLTVNYLRFFWKTKESVEAKVVKRVVFPTELDLGEFVTSDLMEKMAPLRSYFKNAAVEEETQKKRARLEIQKENDRQLNIQRERVDTPPSRSGSPGLTSASTTDCNALIHPSLKSDIGCNPSGFYELVAVLTHIGRNANSGHYIAWVRHENDPVTGSNQIQGASPPSGTSHWWYKFDDNNVSIVSENDIKKLEGGGDWHTAYITLYKAKDLA